MGKGSSKHPTDEKSGAPIPPGDYSNAPIPSNEPSRSPTDVNRQSPDTTTNQNLGISMSDIAKTSRADRRNGEGSSVYAFWQYLPVIWTHGPD